MTNGGRREERATYWVVRDGRRGEANSVELDPNETFEETHSMRFGDEVRFEKKSGDDTLSLSWQLDVPVCVNPVFEVSVGWGALGGGFHCE